MNQPRGWCPRFACALVCICATWSAGVMAQEPARAPASGRDVLERMHAAYAGRWYAQLAFVQHTTLIRADGVRDTATWYESLKGPALLRIDLGAPTAGRGVVFTADSTYRFQGDTLAAATNDGNPFLPLIMGVYLQPVDVTVRAIAHHGVDVSHMHRAQWRGRAVYVVGTSAQGDTTTPQFWVDAERLLLVRMILGLGANRLADISVDGYVQVDGGWLATRITMSMGGTPRQLEEYTEWSTRAPVPDSLFDRKRWVTGGHWATLPRRAPDWARHP
jgi:hypothetical protein